MKIASMVKRMGDEKVRIERKTGEVFENVPAVVSSSSIIFDAQDGAVDVGDKIYRPTPTGTTIYLVEDPGYYPKIGGMSEHFQAKVRRADSPSTTSSPAFSSVTMGDNARININSTDNSTNTINKDSVFNQFRDKIGAEVSDEAVKKQALALVDEMEAAESEEVVTTAMGKFMTLGAQFATIAGPFIPLIMKLFTG